MLYLCGKIHFAMNTNREIGQSILRLRKEKGLSQAQFADKAGISRRYLSDIENGKRQMSLAILERIVRELGVSVGELIDGR